MLTEVQPGQRVSHNHYGLGRVTNFLSESGAADVHFDEHKGYKTVLAIYLSDAEERTEVHHVVESISFAPIVSVDKVELVTPQTKPIGIVDAIQVRFERYHAANPVVYAKLVEVARGLKALGVEHYGIAPLFERVRWHFDIETRDVNKEGFKISDNFKSRYSRLIMDQESDLAGFFTTKKLARERLAA